MKEAEYLRLKRQAMADYQKKIEAIETVWKLAGSKGKPGKSVNAGRKSGLTQEVRDIVQSLHSHFTIRDIEAALIKADSKRAIRLPSLSTILLRLSSDSVIKIVTPGLGRQPTVYAKTTALAEAF